jgi:hypothetical protein
VLPMRVGLLRTSLRFLAWCCVAVLALLSLLPAQDMARTGFPGEVEHFVADAGSAAIATAGYGLNWSATRVIGCFWLYAGILEFLQHFSRRRHPAFLDFAASAMGSLCGGSLSSSSGTVDLGRQAGVTRRSWSAEVVQRVTQGWSLKSHG